MQYYMSGDSQDSESSSISNTA